MSAGFALCNGNLLTRIDGFFQMTGASAEEASGYTSEPRLAKPISSGTPPQRISAQEHFPYEVEEMEEREAASHAR